MFRLPSVRSTVTTLAAAAVLVGGANLASYAANGHPLLLGHANRAVGTTTLKNAGRGPALSLNSSKHSAPFKVNSKKMVKHLNANMVHGRTAGQLEPKTLRFHIGSVGATFPGGATRIFSAKVPKGTYDVGIAGIVSDQTTGTSDSYTCVVADKAALIAAVAGSTTVNLAKVYAADIGTQGDSEFGFMNDMNSAQKISNSNIALGCAFGGTGNTYIEGRTITFTFHPTTAANKKNGGAIPLAKSQARRLATALR
jgi:hypothetical protein